MPRGRKATDVDDYISWHPPEVQQRLAKLRATIHEAVSGAGEKISYDIPTITLDGRSLLYFAAFAKHVSVYPAPRGAPGFADALSPYPGGKGTVQFAHDAPLPYDLVRRMALHHAERIRTASAKQKPAARKTAPAKKAAKRSASPKKSAAKKSAAKKSAKKTTARKGSAR